MAGGMLAPYSEIEHMDMDWVDAGLHSIEIWKNTDLNTGFHQNGSLLIACPEDHHILDRFKNHLPVEVRTPQNVQTLEPSLTPKFQTGLFLNQEAHLDPQKTMTALCAYLDAQPNVTLSQEPTSPRAHEFYD